MSCRPRSPHRRWEGAVRRACGWSWTCPRRWGRGNRRSLPCLREADVVHGGEFPEGAGQAPDAHGDFTRGCWLLRTQTPCPGTLTRHHRSATEMNTSSRRKDLPMVLDRNAFLPQHAQHGSRILFPCKTDMEAISICADAGDPRMVLAISPAALTWSVHTSIMAGQVRSSRSSAGLR